MRGPTCPRCGKPGSSGVIAISPSLGPTGDMYTVGVLVQNPRILVCIGTCSPSSSQRWQSADGGFCPTCTQTLDHRRVKFHPLVCIQNQDSAGVAICRCPHMTKTRQKSDAASVLWALVLAPPSGAGSHDPRFVQQSRVVCRAAYLTIHHLPRFSVTVAPLACAGVDGPECCIRRSALM
jgi:hypothetical protein